MTTNDILIASGLLCPCGKDPSTCFCDYWFKADSVYDIGSRGATRPRTLYVGSTSVPGFSFADDPDIGFYRKP